MRERERRLRRHLARLGGLQCEGSLSVFGKQLEKFEKSGVLLGKNVIRVLVDYLNSFIYLFICMFTCFAR